MTNYIIRKAQEKDSQRIWEIRNHPQSRVFFNSSLPIPFDEHSSWFKTIYLTNPCKNFCFALEYQNDVIGYARFDLKDGGYLVSIAIDPAYRGKGFGNILLSQTTNKVSQECEKKIRAEVLLENILSLKLFQKNQFVIEKQDDKKYYLNYQPN